MMVDKLEAKKISKVILIVAPTETAQKASQNSKCI